MLTQAPAEHVCPDGQDFIAHEALRDSWTAMCCPLHTLTACTSVTTTVLLFATCPLAVTMAWNGRAGVVTTTSQTIGGGALEVPAPTTGKVLSRGARWPPWTSIVTS